MVQLGSMKLKNPIVASSGAMGFGRGYQWQAPLYKRDLIEPAILGAVITKTLTKNYRAGNWKGWNFWQVLWPIRKGWINAIGLTNPGIDQFLESEYQKVYAGNLIVSIADLMAGGVVSMAEKLEDYKMLGIELNISCPNAASWVDWWSQTALIRNIFRTIRSATSHPLIVKIGYFESEPRKRVAEALVTAEVDAVDMVNSIPFHILFPHKRSPLRLGGGISGRIIRDCALKQIEWFSQNTNLPIIGGGGVKTQKDVEKFLAAGASAVSIGSAHILKPWISTKLAESFDNSR